MREGWISLPTRQDDVVDIITLLKDLNPANWLGKLWYWLRRPKLELCFDPEQT